MNRRTLLASIGGAVATGLAGCIEDGATGGVGSGDDDGPGGDNEGTPDRNETRTDPDEEQTAAARGTDIGFVNSSLTIVDVECGQEHDEAEIAFEHDDGEVVVEGTIWGANPCEIPELVDANYDGEADELSVTVGTTERGDESEVCVECVAELDYRVTATFEGGLPGSVRILHDRGDGGDAVATATDE